MNTNTRVALKLSRDAYQNQMKHNVQEAIDIIISMGKTPSFYNVANLAHIARSTLYRRPELKQMVEQARENAFFIDSPNLESLSELVTENRRLKIENEQLRRELSKCISNSQNCEHMNRGSLVEYSFISFEQAA